MFSQQDPVVVRLKEVYQTRRHPQAFVAVASVYACTPHHFTFSLRRDKGTMVPDGVENASSVFAFTQPPLGCFSLASNASAGEAGAFRYIRLTANGETLLNIDFRDLPSVKALETYFDCYYFPDLKRGTVGILTPIERFWTLNERGYLQCVRDCGRIPINDCGPMCVLTLKAENIGDFDADVGVEQSFRRYGIVFGCERGKFPYSSTLKTWETIVTQGGFAFLSPDIRVNHVRGAVFLPKSRNVTPSTPGLFCGVDTDELHDRFGCKQPLSLSRHLLTYHISGNSRYVLSDRTFEAKAGDVVYLPPNTPLRTDDKPADVIAVEFDCVDPIDAAPAFITPTRPGEIRRLFDELMEAWHSTLPGFEYRAFSTFYHIIAELSRRSQGTAAIALQVATEYVDAHYTDPALSAKDIAKAADISESYLYQLFREEIGMSPKEYILKCRLQSACALLKTRYYKVYEVAEKCGFPDSKYFETVFKRKMGVSPGKYSVYKTD